MKQGYAASGVRLSEEAIRGTSDLFYFLTRYWGLDLQELPHREMCAVVESSELESATPFSMLVVPRDCWKTSILRGAAVWKQLRQIHLHDNPYHRIAIMSSTLALGRAALRVIEGQLRYNRDLIAAYGELWTMGSKTEDGIVLAPRIERGEKASIADPSFWIGSERAGQVGRHADEALVDDINNNDNSATIHRREKVHTLWALLFPLIGSHGGRRGKIMMACTPWHDDDVRGRILRTEREREAADADYKSPWRMIHRSILNEDGTSFFPSRYPVERIEKMREDMPVREFAANYLADPIGDAMFVNPTAIVFKPRAEFPTLRDIRIAVDPHQHGEAKKLGCYAAMVAVGYDRFANMYVMDARGSRSWGSSQFIDALFLMGEEYEGIPIYIEDSHMAHFDTAVRLEEAQRSEKEGSRVHLRISYVPVDVKVTYYQRWERVQHRFQRGGAVVFAQEIDPKLKAEIKEELIRGGAARFNDFLDALAIADTGIRPRVAKDGSLIPVAEKKMPSKPGSMTFADAFPGYRGVM